jgi:hypothetical protein
MLKARKGAVVGEISEPLMGVTTFYVRDHPGNHARTIASIGGIYEESNPDKKWGSPAPRKVRTS